MFIRFCFIFLLFAASLEAARLRFAGLQSYTADDLTGTISGRLEYIKKREATTYRADDAAFLIENYLRSHGLPDATVNWSLPGKNTILLTVNEGLTKYLGTIKIEGTDDDPKELVDQFQAPFPHSGKRRAYVESAVTEGLGRVVSLMESRGYWQASATSKKGPRNEAGEFPFTITVKKGPLFTLAAPKIVSPVQPTPDLLQKLSEVVGKEATSSTILSIRKSIDTDYRSRGYPKLSLEMTKESNGSQLRLAFTIKPGKRFKVRSLELEQHGPTKTKPERLNQRIPKVVGKDFDQEEINKSIRKLLTTGAFESIRLETKQVGETQLDLTLHLTEADARGYTFSAGAGSYEGYIIGARYHDRNFMGNLWNFTAGTELNGLGVLGEVNLTNPYFLNRELKFFNSAFLITRDYDSYRKAEGGFTSNLTWKIGDHYTASFGAELSYTTVSSSIPDALIGPTDYTLQRFTFNQTYDRRNDPTLPSNGWFAKVNTSLGLALGSDSVGFFEADGQLSYYKQFSDTNACALSLRGGFIIPSGDDKDLPIDLRKFLGGSHTIRSFPEREMGPAFKGDPLGGTTWWVANAEYIRTLAGPLKGVAFLDTGALDDELEMAVGLGLRVELPIGPIRLEYGRSLTQDGREPSGTFHFSIGASF